MAPVCREMLKSAAFTDSCSEPSFETVRRVSVCRVRRFTYRGYTAGLLQTACSNLIKASCFDHPNRKKCSSQLPTILYDGRGLYYSGASQKMAEASIEPSTEMV
jgi:hypothetical protein